MPLNNVKAQLFPAHNHLFFQHYSCRGRGDQVRCEQVCLSLNYFDIKKSALYNAAVKFLKEKQFKINQLAATAGMAGLATTIFPLQPLSAAIVSTAGLAAGALHYFAEPNTIAEINESPSPESYGAQIRQTAASVRKFARAAGLNDTAVRMHHAEPSGQCIAYADSTMKYVSLDEYHFSDGSPLTREVQDAVIAHEFVHIATREPRIYASQTALLTMIGTSGLALMSTGQPAMAAYATTVMIAALALTRFSGRQSEYMADKWAAAQTGTGKPMADFLQYARDNLVEKSKTAESGIASKTKGWLTRIFAEHPPIERRIERLRAINDARESQPTRALAA